MRYKYLLLGILFLLSIGLNSIYAEYTIDWSIPFSVYRLIYNFTVTSDTPEAYVHVVIPESIIDQYLQYWQNKGIDPFRYHDFYAPRVYFVKVIAPTGPGGTYSLEYYYVQNQIICLSTYNYYCNNFTVYLTNIPAGTHHIVVYMPAFFWEDFEDNSLEAVADAVGECIDGEWCVLRMGGFYAKIASGGFAPTPGRHMFLDTYSGEILIYKTINLNISQYTPLTLEVEMYSHGYAYMALVLEFELTDGSKIAVRYGEYDPPGLPICASVGFGGGILKVDPLLDVSRYCNIPVSKVAKITNIYLGTVYDPSSFDNIKILPAYLYT